VSTAKMVKCQVQSLMGANLLKRGNWDNSKVFHSCEQDHVHSQHVCQGQSDQIAYFSSVNTKLLEVFHLLFIFNHIIADVTFIDCCFQVVQIPLNFANWLQRCHGRLVATHEIQLLAND